MPPLNPVERQLFLAAHCGDVARLSKICTEHANLSVNIVDEAEYAPLTIAIIQGSLEAVQALVTLGADIHKVGKRGLSPLLLACEEDEMEIVSYLIQRGADPIQQCGKRGNLLHMAALYEQEALLEWLVRDCGVPVDIAIQETGQTALHKASALHRGPRVQWLLDQGANPCLPDHQGKTALHHAVASTACSNTATTTTSPEAYASLLTSLAAARAVRDHFGRTALHEACYRQDVQAVKILMRLQPHQDQQAKEDVGMTTVDHLGRTPLFEACHNADILQDMLNRMQELYSPQEILKALNHADPQGWTALHHAVFCGDTAVVELLLSRGARADVKLPGSHQSLLHLVGSGFKVHWDECSKKDPQAWHQQYQYVTDWLLRFGSWFVKYEPIKNGSLKLAIPALPRLASLEESFEVTSNGSSAMSAILLKKAKASVLVKDKEGNLPFFLPAATGNVSEVFDQLRAAAHEGMFHNLRAEPAVVVVAAAAITPASPITVMSATTTTTAICNTPNGKRKAIASVTPLRPTQRLRVEPVNFLHAR